MLQLCIELKPNESIVHKIPTSEKQRKGSSNECDQTHFQNLIAIGLTSYHSPQPIPLILKLRKHCQGCSSLLQTLFGLVE
jgi:hypothetical protein